MEALKFVAVLLVVVAQVFGALGLSNSEEDGELWMVENWQVNRDVFRGSFMGLYSLYCLYKERRTFLMRKTSPSSTGGSYDARLY